MTQMLFASLINVGCSTRARTGQADPLPARSSGGSTSPWRSQTLPLWHSGANQVHSPSLTTPDGAP